MNYEELATQHHAGQMYGNQPYPVHLQTVEQILVDFGYDSVEWRIAAWFHDALEDTKLKPQELLDLYGWHVFRLVWAVTGEGRNRAERQQSIRDKVRCYPLAAILKVADRIANCESGGKLQMYRDEQEDFARVMQPLVPAAMWERLERSLNTNQEPNR